MNRDVYIMSQRDHPLTLVDDKTATKMLEVYDKVQKFEPVVVDSLTKVSVDSTDNFRWFPIELWWDGNLRLCTPVEAKRLSDALLAAIDYVKEKSV